MCAHQIRMRPEARPRKKLLRPYQGVWSTGGVENDQERPRDLNQWAKRRNGAESCSNRSHRGRLFRGLLSPC